MVGKRPGGRRQLFDDWPERYNRWFETPIGRLVKGYETEVTLELLRPEGGERILDAGCGTGIFTLDFLGLGAQVVGLDVSIPMLIHAKQQTWGYPFYSCAADMLRLPFADAAFDKAVSVTAIEFIEDAEAAVAELFRVTRSRGVVVAATLNSLSPWASRRKETASKDSGSIFAKAVFRSPDEMRVLAPVAGRVRTAVHFQKGDDPRKAKAIELEGRLQGLETGAYLAIRWEKP
jgi:ubiquinone/menaquinone biosynthesis C-methylase UbiE